MLAHVLTAEEDQHCLDHLMAQRFMMFLACLGMPVMR